jgi:hypothetical protein
LDRGKLFMEMLRKQEQRNFKSFRRQESSERTNFSKDDFFFADVEDGRFFKHSLRFESSFAF